MRRILSFTYLGIWLLACCSGAFTSISAQHRQAPLPLYTQGMDSVVLIIYHFADREFSVPYPSEKDLSAEADSIYPVLRFHLPSSAANRLRRKLSWPGAYAHGRALPYHFNIGVYYYDHGQLLMEVSLSTLTGNITVQKNHCPYDPMIAIIQGSKEYSQCFEDMFSERFARCWIRLLRKYDLWDTIDPGDRLRIGGA
jgi:hypothetical protein